jgi:F-type H+-transporting ATPase subunit b
MGLLGFSWRNNLLPALVLMVSMFFSTGPAQAQQGAHGQQIAQAEPAQAPSASGQSSTPEAQSPEANQEEKDTNEAYLHSASVKWIAAKLGMSTETAATTFQVVNFTILAGLVCWFLFKTMPGVFKARNTAIQKHLVDARTATEEASARLSSVEARLSKLDEQIAAMRAQAEKDSAADELRIKASVEEEKQKILAAAEQEIGAATTQAQRQLQQYAAELAIEQAARKLVVSAETDRLLVQSFARRLTGGDDSKEGQN